MLEILDASGFAGFVLSGHLLLYPAKVLYIVGVLQGLWLVFNTLLRQIKKEEN